MTGRSAGNDPEHPDPTTDAWSAWLPRFDERPTDPSTPAPTPTAAGPTPPPVPSVPPGSWQATPTPMPAPAASPLGQPYAPSRPTALGLAIFCTIFCFMPFGIVAIVKAASIRPLWLTGRFSEAHRAARSARLWCLAAALVWPGLAVAVAALVIAL